MQLPTMYIRQNARQIRERFWYPKGAKAKKLLKEMEAIRKAGETIFGVGKYMTFYDDNELKQRLKAIRQAHESRES